jgi:VIT1/CCC1 family predicted Fe2+/Mn2+ transporter
MKDLRHVLKDLSIPLAAWHIHRYDGEMTGKKKNDKGLTAASNLRAAIFGVSDGLVSNTSLIMGVSGAISDTRTILITGAAGLLAGALSMAAGEYVSVSSQRELFETEIAKERAELKTQPHEEIDELARIYHRRGLPLEVACRISKALSKDLKVALETHAREELGLNPGDLGSPIGAAISSFVSFGLGALVPLLPFLFGAGRNSFGIAVGLAGISLVLVGVAAAAVTGQRRLHGGVRLLVIGGGAGVVAYLIGKLLGVAI